MTWRIHALVHHANDRDAVSRAAEVDHVPLNMSMTIAWSNMIACGRGLGRLRQLGKGGRQDVGVAIGLVGAPPFGE